ncbi:hypothetical protein [Azospirillum thermophilum]|uniref:Uncharacterized protein n=1 Tax=Azospirillum thermophilum TaxID=2202148 RepID=A0A2S2CMT1_9PROT|nr:hypothetical protein [Azospirillum thermophilum]AWK85776.1 hypothetical protein DEW08_05990 [Azospirillum thermophilum]
MSDDTENAPPKRNGLRLPPIIRPEDRGVGDVVARAAKAAGFTPCSGCQHRQAVLNSWFPFKS